MYVAFGTDSGNRAWEDARTHGFVSASGGAWYTSKIRGLPEGMRVWVHVPGSGYASAPGAALEQFERCYDTLDEAALFSLVLQGRGPANQLAPLLLAEVLELAVAPEQRPLLLLELDKHLRPVVPAVAAALTVGLGPAAGSVGGRQPEGAGGARELGGGRRVGAAGQERCASLRWTTLPCSSSSQ
jgi:hypothetical protein